ncbi:MAG: thiamine phosphate synthase [Acidimicrobiia bacterium]|nr:thiamine phosphate synthase [Acidimicrobiia bacterium]
MTLPRLYAILDVETLQARNFPAVKAAQSMLDGGAQILQWRCKLPPARALFQHAEEIAALCRRFHAQFIVNDRADLALLLDAGLHLGLDDLPPHHARGILSSAAPIGFSTHNREQLLAAASEPINYLALGPIFSTASKLNPDPEVGLRQLQQWRTLTSLPLAAIGGITRKNCLAVFDSGADSVAVISDLLPDDLTTDRIRRRVQEWRSLTG